MMKRILVLIKLRLHRTKLQMALAQVAQFEQFLGYTELLGRFDLCEGLGVVVVI